MYLIAARALPFKIGVNFNREEADETGCIRTAPSCPPTSSSIPAASRTASSQTTT